MECGSPTVIPMFLKSTKYTLDSNCSSFSHFISLVPDNDAKKRTEHTKSWLYAYWWQTKAEEKVSILLPWSTLERIYTTVTAKNFANLNYFVETRTCCSEPNSFTLINPISRKGVTELWILLHKQHLNDMKSGKHMFWIAMFKRLSNGQI